jgi:CheY-like chemotaxis protein
LAQVLVVDDNPVMRTVMRVALERAGHRVAMAEDGERALKAAADGKFDLIITDIQMPRMGGVDLVHALKKTLPEVKVLVISGRVEGPELQGMTSTKTLGATGSLEKPFTADRLVTKVAELLG